MSLLPSSRPRESREELTKRLAALGVPWSEKSVVVVATRGYYRDTMGAVGRNDYGIYDDAIAIVSPHVFAHFNGNTDPSRTGFNAGAGKYMARLKPGSYRFIPLKHHASRPDGYRAFGQGETPVTVERIRSDLTVAQVETGCFGINLHRGGVNGTSSEGCQTVPPDQWPAFFELLTGELNRAQQHTFDYVLTEWKA